MNEEILRLALIRGGLHTQVSVCQQQEARMLQTKQKQPQHFNMYPQMQQFPRVPSAPILSRMPPTRSPMPPLLSLPNQHPRFHPDHHLSSGPRMPNRHTLRPPSPAAFGIGPCSGNPRSLLGPKPMLQQPVIMPQMPGMPQGHRKQVPPQFLPAGVSPSLLGPAPISAPIGAPLRNANLPFFPRQHHPHVAFNNKVSAYTPPQRKRENGYVPAGRSNVQINRSKTNIQAVKVEKKSEQAAKESLVSSLDQTEPPVKKQKNQGAAEVGEAESSADADSSMIPEQEDEEIRSVKAEEDVEQGRTAEVQVVGSSLKVTIQRSSDSRAFSTGLEEIAAAVGQSVDDDKSKTAGKFFCYICNITCGDQQHFQTHMISLGHQQKMMEIQHLSNTCLATLIPQMQQSIQGTNRDKSQDQQRWCEICQNHFTGDVIEHRRTKQHKMAKVSSRPFCTVCERHFRTPRKFVEHMKSPEHKQKVEELKEERGPEVMEELITVDAIGCFEGEDDYEEDDNEDEEEDAVSQQVPEEMNDSKEYDAETQYGTRFVVPVAGFLCKLCHKFYHFESSARETHCKSLVHYENLQKYKAMLNQPQEEEESMATSPWPNPKNVNDGDADMEDKS
ncbi:cdkn1a interacting zinc finger protein 1b isoform X1 [Astyanax mexicanus]|uniref:cdkn1a interacting zinc finger protein 1b isoform X1 n=1 Tax=Astyanax mexicanus TaxID=7994 RepID=UPI0020CAE2DC|nr:cdkn1a interacting zinc finger protein 1b isoform X1 [Astyanax mexicanus]